MLRIIVLLALLTRASSLIAGSATWLTNPVSSSWNTAASWSPATVPNGPADVATFHFSFSTVVSVNANTEVNQIFFDSDASAFSFSTFSNPFAISGVGVTNNSLQTQTFAAAVGGGQAGTINFQNNATAGSNTSYSAGGGVIQFFPSGQINFSNSANAGSANFTIDGGQGQGARGAATEFFDTASAGSAQFTNNAGVARSATNGRIIFHGNSTADHATFLNNGATADITVGATIRFFDNANAGNATFTNNAASNVNALGGAFIGFANTSSAANGMFTANGSAGTGLFSSSMSFLDSSTAANATVVVNGGTGNGGNGATVRFAGTSGAGTANVTINGGATSGAHGAEVFFNENSTANNATLTANGGAAGADGGGITFNASSMGGTARIRLFGNGFLDISSHNSPGLTVGSIEGDGQVFLGGRTLNVGSNNSSTTFSGLLQNGGSSGGINGSLGKIGSGALTLTGNNTYTGGTTIDGGTLSVQTLSAHLGSGNVSVTANAVTLEIMTGVLDAIANSATLTLAGGGAPNIADAGFAALGVGVNEVVGGLVLGGVNQAPGIYGSSTSPALFKSDEYFSGNGIVIVVPEPRSSITAILGAGILFAIRRLSKRRA
jgi:autotransporter-associated beta strand protein